MEGSADVAKRVCCGCAAGIRPSKYLTRHKEMHRVGRRRKDGSKAKGQHARGCTPMNVVMDGLLLRRQMVRRGLSARALAREARLNVQTVLAAMAGHPISVASFRTMSETLERIPVLDIADSLLIDEDDLGNHAPDTHR